MKSFYEIRNIFLSFFINKSRYLKNINNGGKLVFETYSASFTNKFFSLLRLLSYIHPFRMQNIMPFLIKIIAT